MPAREGETSQQSLLGVDPRTDGKQKDKGPQCVCPSHLVEPLWDRLIMASGV